MSVWFEHPAHHGARMWGRPVFSAHLMASTTEELIAFARRIGLQEKWLQHRGEVKEHFDLIGLAKCAQAEAAGAEPVDRRVFVERMRARIPSRSCGSGGWLDVGRGDEHFTCDRPAGHVDDHGQGEVTWARRTP